MHLVDLTSAAADHYAACVADLEQLATCSYPSEAAPQQLRALESQLRERLEVGALSRRGRTALRLHISRALAQVLQQACAAVGSLQS